MKCIFVRRVPFRVAGTSRLVWSVILAEREGLALLFVKKLEDSHSNSIVIATQNVAEKIYEQANTSFFSVEDADLLEAGNILQSVGATLARNEFFKLFQHDDLNPNP